MALKNRIILVESDRGHRKLLDFNLEVYVDVEILHKYNADDVVRFLKEDSNIQAIVSEESVRGEQTILKIYYHIISTKLNVPIILSGHCSKLVGKIEMFPKKEWRNIVRKCAEFLDIGAKDMVSKNVGKYYPVSTKTLLAMVSTPVDIFVQDELDNFKILLRKREKINREDVLKHFLSNKTNLFVLSDKRLKFAESFSEQIFDFIENEDISVEERVEATGMAFEKAHDIIKTMGMSEKAAKMAWATVKSMVVIANSSSGLSDLMDILYKSTESHLYRHSLLIAVLSHHVIGDMGWGNQEQKLKFATAAFFHDIVIPNESLCQINSQKELDVCTISEQDKEGVIRHAYNATELLKSVSDLPHGVDTIVLQHHGALNGIGFKKEEQDGRLAPLSVVFLVVEDCVDWLMEVKKGVMSREQVMEGLAYTYTRGDFGKVANALRRLVS